MAAPPFYPLMTTPAERDCVCEVVPGKLLLTNWRGAEDKEELKRIGVTHVAAVGSEFMEDDEVFHYWKQDIGDDDGQRDEMAKSMVDGAAFCHKAIKGGGCVLVHCAAGMSRSVTVVLAYLMLHGGQTLREAFAVVHAARPGVWPNDGFMEALIAKEAALRGKSTITLEEYVAWGDFEPAEQEAPALPRLLRVETKVSREERLQYRQASSGSALRIMRLGSSNGSTNSSDSNLTCAEESSYGPALTPTRFNQDRRGSINKEELKALKAEAERAAAEARAR